MAKPLRSVAAFHFLYPGRGRGKRGIAKTKDGDIPGASIRKVLYGLKRQCKRFHSFSGRKTPLCLQVGLHYRFSSQAKVPGTTDHSSNQRDKGKIYFFLFASACSIISRIFLWNLFSFFGFFLFSCICACILSLSKIKFLMTSMIPIVIRLETK